MLSRLLSPLFRFFEERVNPYPEGEVTTPPKGLLPFIWHFSRPVWPWLLVMSLITAVVSAAEVVFFSYMGDLVDWLGLCSSALLRCSIKYFETPFFSIFIWKSFILTH